MRERRQAFVILVCLCVLLMVVGITGCVNGGAVSQGEKTADPSGDGSGYRIYCVGYMEGVDIERSFFVITDVQAEIVTAPS